jgi:putative ABC transport system permease protein
MRFFPFRRRENDLDAEIAAHLQMAEQDRRDRGETAPQARSGARREFGSEALVKETTREMWRWNGLRSLARDLRYAARILRKNPGFSAVVIATLALGIGANSAIYSATRAALTPAPIPAIDRVVIVWTDNFKRSEHEFPVSAPDYTDWKDSGAFSSLAIFEQRGRNMRVGSRSERLDGINVTEGFFETIAIPPLLGRVFGPQDAQPGHDDVVILSYRLWRSRFAADPAVVGSRVILDGAAYTIVGVLPAAFPRYGNDPIYCPKLLTDTVDSDRGARHYIALGRLAPGLTFEAVRKRLDDLGTRLASTYPFTNTGTTPRLQPLQEAFVQDARTMLAVLFGAVGFVLLIACANIANLVLARGTSRAREMTVRAALGASRWQLARQSLTENLLLAFAGGLLAIVPAAGAMKLISTFSIEQLPNADLITLDWRVLVFNLVLSAITGIVFGMVPAFQMRNVQVHEALKSAGRAIAGGSHQRLRGLLVVSEVALTLILLAGAGLMARTFLRLRTAYPGYDTRGVLTMKVALPLRQYRAGDRQSAFFARVIEQSAAVPGLRAIGAIDDLPTSDNLHGTGLTFPDRPEPRSEDIPLVLRNSVIGDYFHAMRVPLLRGRYLNDADRKDAPRVAVIDEWTAHRFWPNQDPVGRPFRFGRRGPVHHVVGVVGNVDAGVADTVFKGRVGHFYLSAWQEPQPVMALVTRTDGDPLTLVSGIREVVQRIDVDQPVFDVMTMSAVRAAGSTSQELISLLLGGFAALALVLAAIGIYGVVAYNVGRRTREFGIRMSLGAQRSDVLRLVAGHGLVLAATGIAIGLAGAFALTSVMKDLLYGVAATDPITFAAVTVILAAVTLLAGYLPARRATRIDPVLALRQE